MLKRKTSACQLLMGLAAASLLFTGCSFEKEAAYSSSAADEKAGAPLASLPEHHIFLYAGTNDTVRLQIEDNEHEMSWIPTTPRGMMPELKVYDFDEDGKEELAVILNVGSGTGISLYELHVVEYQSTGVHAGQELLDYIFAQEDYKRKLAKAIQFKKSIKNNELIGQIALDGQTYEVNLGAYQKDYGEEKIGNQLGYGGIVRFEAVEQGLKIVVAVGLVIEGVAEPQYIGEVEAKVTYSPEGIFALGDFQFRAV
ncbi:hypothetical protein [Paenibacillus sp. MMO-58]|uniref:hypothetical protein n=1 Tax=Paenibacillus sp. MMO-58 TaxID=3081290 RepID=UPI003018D4DF